jgi:hypothetical protein
MQEAISRKKFVKNITQWLQISSVTLQISLFNSIVIHPCVTLLQLSLWFLLYYYGYYYLQQSVIIKQIKLGTIDWTAGVWSSVALFVCTSSAPVSRTALWFAQSPTDGVTRYRSWDKCVRSTYLATYFHLALRSRMLVTSPTHLEHCGREVSTHAYSGSLRFETWPGDRLS